jgi:Zn ribbon nucleic-acid-binding protein
MSKRVFRSQAEPDRHGLSWKERWKGDDAGLIECWECGRRLREKDPELAKRAQDGELPVLGWKGGVEKQLKSKKKYGTFNYLAQWQGLRGDDLDIDPSQEVSLTCSKTAITVIYTEDITKYGNA